MTIALLTFVVVLGIIFGAYHAFVVRQERDDRSKLLRRLDLPGSRNQGRESGALERPEDKLSHIRVLQSVLLRAKGISVPLERMIAQAGMSITTGTLVLSSVLLGLAGYVVIKVLTHVTALALIGGLLLACLPILFVRWKRARRFRTFEAQFPEAIELLARALRAGHAFPTGILMVADEMPEPMGSEFRLLYDRQNFGMSLGDALRDMAARVPILDARFFTTAVLTQRETGGNLSEILDNLAAVIRDRFTFKRQVRSVTAHGRMTGWVLTALAPALALILNVISPAFIGPMFSDPIGVTMITAGCTLQLIGTLVIRKLVNIRY